MPVIPTPLDPLSVLLLQVGELNGKADGIIRQLDTVLADNILCHADRENLYGDLHKVESKQRWMMGVAFGAWGIVGVALSYLGVHSLHQ